MKTTQQHSTGDRLRHTSIRKGNRRRQVTLLMAAWSW